MDPVAVGSHVARGGKTRLAAGDELQETTGHQTGHHLRADVCRSVLPLEAPGNSQTDGDGRVEVGTGHVTHGVGHRQNGEAEGQRDPDKADAEREEAGIADELGGDHCAAATTENEPEGAKKLGTQPGGHLGGVHVGPRSELPRRECMGDLSQLDDAAVMAGTVKARWRNST